MLYPLEVNLVSLTNPAARTTLMNAVVAAIVSEASRAPSDGDVANLLKSKLGDGWYVHAGGSHYAIHEVNPDGEVDDQRLVLLGKADRAAQGFTPAPR